MLAIEVKRGSFRVVLAVLAAIILAAIASCTTRSANLQQPAAPLPKTQPEQSAELLSPLALLKSSSATPGRYIVANTSTSFLSNLFTGNHFVPNDGEKTGELSLQAVAAFHLNAAGYDGPYGMRTTWLQNFGDYHELWVGLSDWEQNSWSWTLTDEGYIDSEIIEPHISNSGDLLVVIVVGGDTMRTIDWIRIGSDVPPTAKIAAAEYVGVLPMSVTLSAEGSQDSEGGIEYAWDDRGDGTFTEYSASPEHSYTITDSPAGQPVVRVRDYAGNTTDAVLEQSIIILGAPTMSLSADWGFGDIVSDKGLGTLEAPYFLHDSFNGRQIHCFVSVGTDGDGDPVDPIRLNWALLGDPNEEVLSWTAPGELVVLEDRTSVIGVVAYDDENNPTNVVYFLRGSPVGYEVVFCFNSSQTTGEYPLQVDFNHTVSYVSDHYLDYPDSVSWDFDVEGIADHSTEYLLSDHGMYGASFVFHEPGTYTVTASPVWDEPFPPYQPTFSKVITVTDNGEPKWHFKEIPLPDNLIPGELSSRPLELVEIQGKPAILAYTIPDGGGDQFFIVRALDSLGSEWDSTATVIDLAIGSLTTIGGLPAGLIPGGDSLSYVQALDAAGTTWDTPVTIYEGSFNYNHYELVDINGSPGVVVSAWRYPDPYDLVFIGYDGVTAPNGWFNVVLDTTCNETSYENFSLSEVNGQPAVAYTYQAEQWGDVDVRFMRATDGIGKVWGQPVTVDTGSNWLFGTATSLTVVNGLPAVCHYSGGYPESLRFSMAASPSGSSWNPALAVGGILANQQESWMFEFESKPLIISREIAWQGADLLRMWAPEDGEGTFWREASPVFSTEFNSVKPAIIDGKPAVVMIRDQWDRSNGTRDYELRFGILY